MTLKNSKWPPENVGGGQWWPSEILTWVKHWLSGGHFYATILSKIRYDKLYFESASQITIQNILPSALGHSRRVLIVQFGEKYVTGPTSGTAQLGWLCLFPSESTQFPVILAGSGLSIFHYILTDIEDTDGLSWGGGSRQFCWEIHVLCETTTTRKVTADCWDILAGLFILLFYLLPVQFEPTWQRYVASHWDNFLAVQD